MAAEAAEVTVCRCLSYSSCISVLASSSKPSLSPCCSLIRWAVKPNSWCAGILPYSPASAVAQQLSTQRQDGQVQIENFIHRSPGALVHPKSYAGVHKYPIKGPLILLTPNYHLQKIRLSKDWHSPQSRRCSRSLYQFSPELLTALLWGESMQRVPVVLCSYRSRS